ncbi:MAG TPA: thiamine phosphate synthase [Mycobacteriales bacterium]
MTDWRLYLVTDTTLCGARGVPAVVEQALGGGVSVVQVRDPHASARELVTLTRAVLTVVSGRVPVIVNDRVDVAVAAGADGVHIGQSDLDPVSVRAIAPDLIVGLSVTTLAEAVAAQAQSVDYLGAGPVFSTPTKPDAAAAIGVEGLAAICAASILPVVAIGGLSAQHSPDVRRAGAAGICVVSAICAADDPRFAAVALAAAWS